MSRCGCSSGSSRIEIEQGHVFVNESENTNVNSKSSTPVVECRTEITRSSFQTTDNLTLSYLQCDCRKRCRCDPCTCDPCECTTSQCPEDDGRPVVVLLHGVGSSANYWRCLMRKLCPIANVFALDLPGAGESQAPPEITLAGLTQYVVELLDSLCVTAPVYFVGHGLGGIIALNFSILYPDRVNKIVVSSVNPQSFPIIGSLWPYFINPELLALLNQALQPGADLDTIVPIVNSLVDPIECPATQFLIGQYISTVSQYLLYIPFIRTLDFRSQVSLVTVPVLITSGTADPFAPTGAADFLRSNIPKSALVEFYGYGYNFPVLNTRLFNKDVANFFFVRCDPCCAFLETIPQPEDGPDCDAINGIDTSICHHRANPLGYEFKHIIEPRFTQ